MTKPITMGGYRADITDGCERVLVTLMRGLGPYAKCVFLVGGLVPRYLIKARPPEVPAHAGTGDVDVVLDASILAEAEAYHTLEQNLKRMGFDRGTNSAGTKVSWRWEARLETDEVMVLEFLVDAPAGDGGQIREIQGAGAISAIGIPHAAIVQDHHETAEVTVELLGGEGVVTETVRYADLVCFVCLKAYAFGQRGERKDAHDLVYSLEQTEGGVDAAADRFKNALNGRHREAIAEALSIVAKHFADDGVVEGYRKDGPVKAARFEGDEGDEDDGARERRLLRQRQIAELAMRFLRQLDAVAA